MNALAFRLFGKKFTQPVTGADFIGYTESVLTTHLSGFELKKIEERYFYLETPYANEEWDILKMARAIKCKQKKEKIDFQAPPFYGNMMSIIYRIS